MSGVLRIFSGLLLAMALLACKPERPPLPHDAYIWQRQWTPALREALDASGDLLRQWRVLAAQSDPQGHLQVFAVDRQALALSGKPLVMVIRLDGSLTAWDEPALVEQIIALREAWAGSRLAGVEIDYDCATSRLPAYGHFINALKSRLGTVPLSITALPTWLGSGALDPLLASADEVVLQVHAVLSPERGLFDPALAEQWIEAFARRTEKPFRVALPTYGSRVSWDDQGRLAAIQSEAPVLTAGNDPLELAASPAQVQSLLARLNLQPPKHLAGIVWFRLPTAGDERAWSLATWRAVILGHYVEPQLTTGFEPGQVPGALDVWLGNDSRLDATPPNVVALPDGCENADGINGYRLLREGRHVSLITHDLRLLRAGAQRAVGWTRCSPLSMNSTGTSQ